MKSNETVGRYPDGGGVFRMNVPTIGKANIHTSYMQEEETLTNIEHGIYNVIEHGISLRYMGNTIKIKCNSLQADLVLYSVEGNIVYSETIDVNGTEEIAVGFLPKGCYIARCRGADGEVSVCKFVVAQ